MGGAERPALGSCPQGGDSLVDGGRVDVYRHSSRRLGSGARLLGLSLFGCMTLGKWLNLSEPPHFPHL